jgi:hypothetical protein
MKVFSPRGWAIALAAIGLALSAQPAKASFWTFSDSSNRAASADFSLVGNTLTITLTNTATVAPNDPAHVLTAIFFNTSGAGGINFTPLGMGTSAAVASGSANTVGNYTGDIGGEWAFKSGVNSFSYGLSSSGLGSLFGAGDRFNSNDLTPPDSPNGIEWGIVNAGYVNGDGNGGINDQPFVRDTATFTFTVTNGFSVDNITRVNFVYGTALGEGGGDGGGGGGNAVPAPAGLILLATALPVFAFRRLIRRKPTVA